MTTTSSLTPLAQHARRLWREQEAYVVNTIQRAGDSPAEVAAADEVNAAWQHLHRALWRLECSKQA